MGVMEAEGGGQHCIPCLLSQISPAHDVDCPFISLVICCCHLYRFLTEPLMFFLRLKSLFGPDAGVAGTQLLFPAGRRRGAMTSRTGAMTMSSRDTLGVCNATYAARPRRSAITIIWGWNNIRAGRTKEHRRGREADVPGPVRPSVHRARQAANRARSQEVGAGCFARAAVAAGLRGIALRERGMHPSAWQVTLSAARAGRRSRGESSSRSLRRGEPSYLQAN